MPRYYGFRRRLNRKTEKIKDSGTLAFPIRPDVEGVTQHTSMINNQDTSMQQLSIVLADAQVPCTLKGPIVKVTMTPCSTTDANKYELFSSQTAAASNTARVGWRLVRLPQNASLQSVLPEMLKPNGLSYGTPVDLILSGDSIVSKTITGTNVNSITSVEKWEDEVSGGTMRKMQEGDSLILILAAQVSMPIAVSWSFVGFCQTSP